MPLTITEDEFETLAFNLGNDSESDHREYSGRGMYGKACIGFTIENRAASVLRVGLAVMQSFDEETAESIIDRAAWDSMGLNMIVYFPGVTIAEKE